MTTMTPEKEQKFLKDSAILGVLVGGLFSLEFFTEIFPWLSGPDAPYLVSAILGIAWLLALITYVFKTLKGSMSFNKKGFWAGKFSDEYLNHVNLKGYKYAFNITVVSLLCCFVLSKFHVMDGLSIELLIKGVMGVCFLGYALPVMFFLRGGDE